jgi:hypothetical protein
MKKFAFKLNAGYLSGFDWYANNRTDVSALTPPHFRGPNNPGKDELNTYGDKIARTISGIGKKLLIGTAHSLETEAEESIPILWWICSSTKSYPNKTS